MARTLQGTDAAGAQQGKPDKMMVLERGISSFTLWSSPDQCYSAPGSTLGVVGIQNCLKQVSLPLFLSTFKKHLGSYYILGPVPGVGIK